MEQLKIKHASAMPAPTWSWLRMNDTEISLPAALARGGDIEIEAPDTLLDTASTFEGALAELQEHLDAKRTNATDDRACVRAAQMDQEGTGGRETSDGSLGDLDTPALSRYQKRATLEEVAGDVTRAFETGIGMDARSYLNFAAGETVTIATEAGSTGEATIRVTGDAGTTVAASIDAVAAPDSSLSLTIAPRRRSRQLRRRILQPRARRRHRLGATRLRWRALARRCHRLRHRGRWLCSSR